MTEPAGNPGLIKNADTAAATLVAPSGSTVYQLMLTVTDDAGRVDSAPVIVTSGMANSTAPASAGDSACLTAVSYSDAAPPTAQATGSSSSGGGGGGGATDPVTLLGAMLMAGVAARGRYVRRSAASSHSRCARR